MTTALRAGLPRRVRRPRLGLVVAAVVAVAAVAAIAGVTAGAPGGGGRPVPPSAASDQVVAEAPVAYAITYEVVLVDGTDLAEEVRVQRPFRSEVRSGPTGRVSDLGALATRGGDQQWLRIEVPLAIASGDLRLDAVLAEAIDAGHVEVRGQHRIAGTSCLEHRFGGPVSSGVLTPVGATPGEHADVCVDDRGLVLRERWVVDGRTLRERTATAVAVGGAGTAPADLPPSARRLEPEAGGGAVESVADDHDAGFAEAWRVQVPAGFTHHGRWLVVPPALDRPDGTAPRRTEVALVSDAWVRGADVVLLDQGATLPGVPPPWDRRPVTTTADLGRLGTAEVAWDLRTSEVRILRPDGGFVRIAGTLPPDELVAIARTLTDRTPGGPT